MELKKKYFITILYLCGYCNSNADGKLKETSVNCTTEAITSFCRNCETVAACSTNDAETLTTCTSEQVCQQTDGFAYCTASSALPECACQDGVNGQFADQYDDAQFLVCVNGVRKIETCADGQYFDANMQICKDRESIPDLSANCTSGIFHAVQYNCTSYFFCFMDETASEVLSCNSGEIFDESQGRCVFYEPFSCADYATTGDKYYPDTHNCSRYYLCVNGEQLGEFSECQSEEVWDVTQQTCTVDSTACTEIKDCGICTDDKQVITIDCYSYYQCTASTTGDLPYVPVEKICPPNFYFDPENKYCTTIPPSGCP